MCIKTKKYLFFLLLILLLKRLAFQIIRLFTKTNKMKEQPTNRRGFMSTVLVGATAFGLSSLIAPVKILGATKNISPEVNDAEKWFEQVKGKHKMVFDVPKHNDGRAIGWALALMDTYKELGTPDSELSIVLIFRAGGTPLAIADPLWLKYELSKRIEMKDPVTKVYAKKNLFAKCKTEEDDCLELFQKRGGLVGVCNHAIEGMAKGFAKKKKLKEEDVIKEFKDNLLPGIQLMPSGIWAINRAQELGCAFSYGG